MSLWVCEYSPDQKAFHVSTLDKALESNAWMMTTGCFSGFIPLGVFKTALEAHWCAEYWETLVNTRKGGART